MDEQDISVKELEQLYDRCDSEGVPSDEELRKLVEQMNHTAPIKQPKPRKR